MSAGRHYMSQQEESTPTRWRQRRHAHASKENGTVAHPSDVSQPYLTGLGSTAERLPIKALADLYECRYARFLRVAEAITNDLECARDVVHDAFVQALLHRDDYRGTGTPEAWVWSCVVNAARRRAGLGAPLRDDLVDTDLREGNQPNDGLRRAIRRLPTKQRLILFLRYYADLDYQAIADALDIDLGTVGASLHKSRETLRISLEGTRR